MERGKVFIENLAKILESKGYSISDVNFSETPERVFSWIDNLLSLEEAREKALGHLKKVFPSQYNGMIVFKDMRVNSFCPHHLLPVIYSIDFAYIPDGFVLGLSKVYRYISDYAKALMLQEDFTKRIVDLFVEYVNPKGVGVVVRGVHGCMKYRGVEEEIEVVTSSLYGLFYDQEVKVEFFKLIER
ncbi:MAG: GTP cyclohydrolase I [Archaeoglobaceae archaeon]